MGKHQVYIVAGLGFGDEGKGTIVDYLCRCVAPQAVVRYNGGPQAAHHVVLPDGRWHCFSQSTSGSFVPEVHSHLAHMMLVKPSNLLVEQDLLKQKGVLDVAARSSISPSASIVTPWDAMLGRMEEVARGSNPHGSVGMGVGKAALDRANKNPKALHMYDLVQLEKLKDKLELLWEEKCLYAQKTMNMHASNQELQHIFRYYNEETNPAVMLQEYSRCGSVLGPRLRSDEEFISEKLGNEATLVLEGAQGVLLDNHYGFYPHITKTDTTFQSARGFLEAGLMDADRHTIGVLRAYATRHGAGPLVTENNFLKSIFPENHNGNHRWQGTFRVGYFDLLTSRYAVQVSGVPNYLALTHLDYVGKQAHFSICNSYRYNGTAARKELEEYFELDKIGKNYIVQSIHVPTNPTVSRQKRLTDLLKECEPQSMLEFAGWGAGKPLRGEELPLNLLRLISYLEGGLSCPIRILSFGPTANDKMWLGDHY